jgi:hypothetical protein
MHTEKMGQVVLGKIEVTVFFLLKLVIQTVFFLLQIQEKFSLYGKFKFHHALLQLTH